MLCGLDRPLFISFISLGSVNLFPWRFWWPPFDCWLVGQPVCSFPAKSPTHVSVGWGLIYTNLNLYCPIWAQGFQTCFEGHFAAEGNVLCYSKYQLQWISPAVVFILNFLLVVSRWSLKFFWWLTRPVFDMYLTNMICPLTCTPSPWGLDRLSYLIPTLVGLVSHPLLLSPGFPSRYILLFVLCILPLWT